MSSRKMDTVDRMVQMKGDFALFSRVDSGRDRVTYMFPTPGALRGFGQTLYHTPRLEMVPLEVQLLNPPRVIGVKRTNLTNIVYGGPGTVEQAPDSAVYLYDVRYRVRYRITGPQDDIHRWERRVAAGAFSSPPFLGTRECLAVLEPVDDTPPVDVNLFEPAMPLSNNGVMRRVMCEKGVVIFPEETAQALRNRRRGPTLVLEDET